MYKVLKEKIKVWQQQETQNSEAAPGHPIPVTVDAESEPWLEFASKWWRKEPPGKKQSMVEEEELLSHFFPRTFPFCFVLRLFH